jgi:hypothetical protein
VHDSTKRLRGEQFDTDASWRIPLGTATSVGAGGGCNDQNPARPSSVFLLGRVRHGDRARGSEPAHLRGWDLSGSAAMLPGRPFGGQRPRKNYARFRQFFSVLVLWNVPMA